MSHENPTSLHEEMRASHSPLNWPLSSYRNCLKLANESLLAGNVLEAVIYERDALRYYRKGDFQFPYGYVPQDIEWKYDGCPCTKYFDVDVCFCSNRERVVRAVEQGLVKFTPAQREYCVQYIEGTEGWDWYEIPEDDDEAVACAMMECWRQVAEEHGLY